MLKKAGGGLRGRGEGGAGLWWRCSVACCRLAAPSPLALPRPHRRGSCTLCLRVCSTRSQPVARTLDTGSSRPSSQPKQRAEWTRSTTAHATPCHSHQHVAPLPARAPRLRPSLRSPASQRRAVASAAAASERAHEGARRRTPTGAGAVTNAAPTKQLSGSSSDSDSDSDTLGLRAGTESARAGDAASSSHISRRTSNGRRRALCLMTGGGCILTCR